MPAAPDPRDPVSARAVEMMGGVAQLLAAAGRADTAIAGCAGAVAGALDALAVRVWLRHPPAEGWRVTASAGGGAGAAEPPSTELALLDAWEGTASAATGGTWEREEPGGPGKGRVAVGGCPLVVQDRLVGALTVVTREPPVALQCAAVEAVAGALAAALGRIGAAERRREDAEIIEAVARIGALIGQGQNLDGIVQAATDAATRVSGARFGALFYNAEGEDGEYYQLYSVSGIDRQDFGAFPVPRITPLLEPTFRGTGTVRSDDITADPRYGRHAPHFGMPEGHPPVRSYLAVPVLSRSSGVLGGMLFGHEEPGVFDDRAERIVVGIATQAGMAIESVASYEREHRLAVRLQHSLLPHEVPPVEGVEIAVRYQPHSTGMEVGGDWYEVTRLLDGRVALSVGDAMGHDLRAASAMSRVRHVVRAYSLDGHPPSEVLGRTNRLLAHVGYNHLVTAFHAHFDPVTGGLESANAGHMPPLLLPPGGPPTWLDVPPGPPVGAGLVADYPAAEHKVGPGSLLVLYTDGLVERRSADLEEGLGRLALAADAVRDAPVDEVCDRLLAELGADAGDDIAIVALRSAP